MNTGGNNLSDDPRDQGVNKVELSHLLKVCPNYKVPSGTNEIIIQVVLGKKVLQKDIRIDKHITCALTCMLVFR